MRVVLLHDWLTGFRGGERVLEAFCEIFPHAPIYTMFFQKGSTSSLIDQKTIYTSYLNKIPNVHKFYRKLLPLYPHAINSFKIEDNFDLVLSSSHCVIKGLKKPNGSVHISYIHSPMRYMYDQYDNYFGANAPGYQRAGAKVFKKYITNWDLRSNMNVDYMIANSNFVNRRISKYYGRDSKVIHPFVDLKDFSEYRNKASLKKDYYLIVSAFAPNKRVDLAIEAFAVSGKKLKIIGCGQQERLLRLKSTENVEFLGALTRSEVIKYLSEARALIFPGVEDFGIVPLESLAAGTPVVAFADGGVLETLNEDVAEFFHSPSAEAIIEAVERIEKRQFSHDDLVSRASCFSKELFKDKILSEIKSAGISV